MRHASLVVGCLALFAPFTGGCSAAPSSDLASSSAHLDNASAATSASLIFSANGSYGASSPLVAGETITVEYDAARAAACAETENGNPVYGTTGYAQLNGGAITSFYAAGLDPSPGAPSAFTLAAGSGGDLAVWFETTNVSGCHIWDSNYGTNFHFQVAASADAPGWLGNADSVVSRETCNNAPCDSDRYDLSKGFTYDDWARERAAVAEVEFQTYKSGVTDFANPNLWKELDVEVHYRFGGEGAYTTSYVSFEDRVGNNARYAVDLRSIDPLGGLNGQGGALTSASQCPAFTLTTSADGMSVVAPIDFWFTVNGVELRPTADGVSTFGGTFSNALALYQVCVPPAASVTKR